MSALILRRQMSFNWMRSWRKYTVRHLQAVATHLSSTTAQMLLPNMKVLLSSSENHPSNQDLITFCKLSIFFFYPRVRGVYIHFFFFGLVTPPRNWPILRLCVYNSRADGQLEGGLFNIWAHMKMIYPCITWTIWFWHSNRERLPVEVYVLHFTTISSFCIESNLSQFTVFIPPILSWTNFSLRALHQMSVLWPQPGVGPDKWTSSGRLWDVSVRNQDRASHDLDGRIVSESQ